MQRAVRALTVKPDFLLIDGNRFSPIDGIPYQTVVHGDATFASIAAVIGRMEMRKLTNIFRESCALRCTTPARLSSRRATSGSGRSGYKGPR